MRPGAIEVGPQRYRETFGRYFEDFAVGDVYEHRPGRTNIGVYPPLAASLINPTSVGQAGFHLVHPFREKAGLPVGPARGRRRGLADRLQQDPSLFRVKMR